MKLECERLYTFEVSVESVVRLLESGLVLDVASEFPIYFNHWYLGILLHVIGHFDGQFLQEIIQMDVIDRGFDSQLLNLMDQINEDVVETEP